MVETKGRRHGGVTARRCLTLPVAALLLLVLGACCVGLAACGSRPGLGGTIGLGNASPLVTPACYVFESVTVDGDTIYDPSELFGERLVRPSPGTTSRSRSLNESEGRLCTDGRFADFTYSRSGDTIVLDVPLGLGFDGARLRLGEDTLTMGETGKRCVPRLVDEAPAAALEAR